MGGMGGVDPPPLMPIFSVNVFLLHAAVVGRWGVDVPHLAFNLAGLRLFRDRGVRKVFVGGGSGSEVANPPHL